MDYELLEKNLFDYEVYNAWQFVANTVKTIETAEFCKDSIESLLLKIKDEHNDWLDQLYKQITEDISTVKSISIKSSDLNIHKTNIGSKEIDDVFIIEKLIKDFFQYCRNSFDSISQIANAGFLATKAKNIDSVDFPKMVGVFNQQTYSGKFPNVSAWYNKINNSNEFKYIDAFCNRTKHTCDVHLELSLAILGTNDISKINPFFKRDVQFADRDIASYLDSIYNYVEKSFDDFLQILENEIKNKTYVENRVHMLKCEQQYMKENHTGDYSIIYIDEVGKINSMPNEIEIMLLSKSNNGEINSKNCNIDNIYVKSKNNSKEYVGKYEAIDPSCDDTLLRYRHYKKILAKDCTVPMFIENKINWDKNKLFYRWNPYIYINIISDDDDFKKRAQLPF